MGKNDGTTSLEVFSSGALLLESEITLIERIVIMKTQASKLVASFLALIVALALVATPLLASPAPTQTKAATAVNIITPEGTINSANAETAGILRNQMTATSQSDGNGVTKTGMNFPAGNSDYVEITNTSWMNGSGFSWTGWLYWRGEEGSSQLHWQRVFDFGYESSTGAASCFYFTPLGMKNNEITGAAAIDGMGFCMYENASASTTTADDYVCLSPSAGTNAMAGGTWVHIACTVSGSTASLYLNGSLYASTNIGTSWSNLVNNKDASNFKLYLGRSNKASDSKMGYNGLMSDVNVYDGALSASEIASLAQSGGGGVSIPGSNTNTNNPTGPVGPQDGQQSSEETVTVEVNPEFDLSAIESSVGSAAETEVAASAPTTLTSSVFSALQNSGNTLSLDVVNSSNALLYNWTFSGADITDASKEVNLEIVTNGTSDAISALVGSDYYPYILNFSNKGDLPGKATIRVYVGDMYADSQPLYLYMYNEESQELEPISTDLVVENGYVTFDTEKTGDMVFTISPLAGVSNAVTTTTSTVSESVTEVVESHDNGTAIMILWIVVAALVVLGVGAIVILQVVSKKPKE